MQSALQLWRVSVEQRLVDFQGDLKDKDDLLRYAVLLGDYLRANGILAPDKFRMLIREQIDLITSEVLAQIAATEVPDEDVLFSSEEDAANAGWATLLCKRDGWESVVFFLSHWAVETGETVALITFSIIQARRIFDEKICVLVRKACFDPLRLLYGRSVLVLNNYQEPKYVCWDGADSEWPRVSNIALPVVDDNIPVEMLVMFTTVGQFEDRVRAACEDRVCALHALEMMQAITSCDLKLHPAAQKLFDELRAKRFR